MFDNISVRAGGGEGRGAAAPPVPENCGIFRANRSKFGQQHLGEKTKTLEKTKNKKRNNGFHSKIKVVETRLRLLTHVFVSRRITDSVLIVFFAYNFVTGVVWFACLHCG